MLNRAKCTLSAALDAFNLAGDIFGRTCCLICQVFNLGCDNRKTLASFTGAGGFNCRVKGQKVGLRFVKVAEQLAPVL